MTKYELMVLVAPTLDMTDAKAQRDLIEKLVGSGGTIQEIVSQGKKSLSYPIGKFTEATYLIAKLEGTVRSADIQNKSRIMDDVLRFLLTVSE